MGGTPSYISTYYTVADGVQPGHSQAHSQRLHMKSSLSGRTAIIQLKIRFLGYPASPHTHLRLKELRKG